MLNMDEWLKHRIAKSRYIPRTFDCRDTFDLDNFNDYSDTANGDALSLRRVPPVQSWGVNEIANWLVDEAQKLNVDYTELHGETFFLLRGPDLEKMKESEFCQVTADYGRHLYESIQRLKNEKPWLGCQVLDNNDNLCYGLNSVLVNDNGNAELKPTNSYLKTTVTEDVACGSNLPTKTMSNPPEKKGRGRPKNPFKQGKKKAATLGRVWEFLRGLLKDPTFCPSMIKWDNHEEGTFCFVKSEHVAKLWGSRKGNVAMNYEKLSRAIRYYYKSKILLPVYGRRLVYKFGPKATGWRVNDPNFEKAKQLQ